MGAKAKQAVENHKNWYSCSGAVLCAFAEDAGLSEQEAQRLARPIAGGRQGGCGAYLAAVTVLEKKFGEKAAEPYIENLERQFTGRNGSTQCRDLMGRCRKCVTDAAEILESVLAE